MVLYGLPIISLPNALRAADPGVLHPWYADNAAMRGTARQNAKLLCALMLKGPCHGYFPET